MEQLFLITNFLIALFNFSARNFTLLVIETDAIAVDSIDAVFF